MKGAPLSVYTVVATVTKICSFHVPHYCPSMKIADIGHSSALTRSSGSKK